LNYVSDILKNPAVKAGLSLASPQAALIAEGIQALMLSFGSQKKSHKAEEVFRVIDARAAQLIKELSETKSTIRKGELEIRLHELLEIGQRWDRIT
jgi:hypothetical protein